MCVRRRKVDSCKHPTRYEPLLRVLSVRIDCCIDEKHETGEARAVCRGRMGIGDDTLMRRWLPNIGGAFDVDSSNEPFVDSDVAALVLVLSC